MTIDASPKTRAWIIAAMVFVLGFDLAFLWQRRAGATTSEFGGHPEEAAHYVTGLAVQNYLAHNFGTAPQNSLAEFSTHYPIVRSLAPAPLFPVALATWTSVFGKSRTSVLLLMCFLAALVALLLHLAVRREFGEAAGAIAAALFLSLPLVREHTATLLPAMLCTVFMFAAALAFARLIERARIADGLWFGLCAALALLTDRAALALLLFIPLALGLSGKWRLLTRPAFWIGLALTAPPVSHFRTTDWTRVSVDFTRAAASFYAAQLAAAVGAILLLIKLPSLIAKICRSAERTARWSAAAALLLGIVVFIVLFPAELEAHRVLPALPAALMFAVAGCAAIAKRLGRSTGFILLLAGVLTLVLSETVMVTWRTKKWSGFQSLAEIVLNSGEHPQARILVCSDPTGEGMFISEIALGEPRPARLIERADTLFANTKFADDESLANLIGAHHFDYIVFDESNPDLEHANQHDMLRRVLREPSDRFWEMSSAPVIRDGLPQDQPARLYRVTGKN